MTKRILVGMLLLAACSTPAWAQRLPRVVPTNQTVISGYGTAGYSFATQGDNANAFLASISPIFLFHFADRFLFEAELEFELQGEGTETGLEYGQLDYLASNNITLAGGKFLLPFGVFGERLHPTWINKFPSPPPIYGHGMTMFGAEPMLPVLSDVGFMARGTVTPGPWNLSLNAYVTQGPGQEESTDSTAPPEVHFPASSSDNNSNKMFGGRLDVVLPPWMEINGSALRGNYDDANSLTFTAWNLAAEAHWSALEFRGEFMRTLQEVPDAGAVVTRQRDGLYGQLAYRWRRLEPVVRWTQAFDTKQDGVVDEEGASQLGLGCSFWFGPSIALMAGYELNNEKGQEIDNNRLVAHVAFGF